MQAVKTAVSIEKQLFDQAELVAQAMRVSRSRLFGLALEEFISRQKNKELLARINAAYSDEPDAEEQTLRRHARKQHRRITGDEW